MSEGHTSLNIILICFMRFSRNTSFIPHASLSSSLSILLLAGDITQMSLPVGMQSVDFSECEGLTGTAES